MHYIYFQITGKHINRLHIFKVVLFSHIKISSHELYSWALIKLSELISKHPVLLPGIIVRPHHLPVVEAPKYHGAFTPDLKAPVSTENTELSSSLPTIMISYIQKTPKKKPFRMRLRDQLKNKSK